MKNEIDVAVKEEVHDCGLTSRLSRQLFGSERKFTGGEPDSFGLGGAEHRPALKGDGACPVSVELVESLRCL
jgi:hypothetical protein